MSAEDSGQYNPPPVEPFVPPAPALAADDNAERGNVRLRFQLGQEEDAVTATNERRQHQETVDALQEQMAALTRQNHQLQREMNLARQNADQAARERTRSRFSSLHTPLASTRSAPQSTPFAAARASSPNRSGSVPNEFFSYIEAADVLRCSQERSNIAARLAIRVSQLLRRGRTKYTNRTGKMHCRRVIVVRARCLALVSHRVYTVNQAGSHYVGFLYAMHHRQVRTRSRRIHCAHRTEVNTTDRYYRRIQRIIQ